MSGKSRTFLELSPSVLTAKYLYLCLTTYKRRVSPPWNSLASLRESFSKYLNNPQVTVTVTEINSRRVYITGEVTTRARYHFCLI